MADTALTSSAKPHVPGRLLMWFTDSVRGRRGFWAWLGGFFALYLALQVIFLALTVAAAAVPNAAVVKALATSAAQGQWDALDFPSDGIGHTTSRHPFAGVSDSYTECIALTTGVSNDVSDALSPLLRSLTWPHLGTCSVAYPAIQELAAGQDSANVYKYDRYWIGSAVLTRPLLVLAGVGGVRLAAAAVFLLGFVLAAVSLARRASPWTPILLFAPLLLSTNIVTQTLDSYPHVLSMGVALLGVALGVRLGRESAPAIIAYALVAGGTFNFVDFLLNPPVAWSLFVFGVVVGRLGSNRARDFRSLVLVLASGVAGWILGYMLTWAMRWLLAIFTYGADAFDEILGMIFTRLGGEYGDLVIPGLTMPTRRNVSFWIDTIPTAPLIAILFATLIVAALVILVARRQWRALLIVIIAAAPALLIPIWYETLSNHSQIHMWFTYRAVPIGLGILAAAAWLPIVMRSRRSEHVAETAEGRPTRYATGGGPVGAFAGTITG